MPKDYESAIAKLSVEEQKSEVAVLRALLVCYLGVFANTESTSKLIAAQGFIAKKTGFLLQYVEEFLQLLRQKEPQENSKNFLGAIHKIMSSKPYNKTDEIFLLLKIFFKKFIEHAKEIISSGEYAKDSAVFQAASAAKREVERDIKVQSWVHEKIKAIQAESSWTKICDDIEWLLEVKLGEEIVCILDGLLYRIREYVVNGINRQPTMTIDEVDVVFELLRRFLQKYPHSEEYVCRNLLKALTAHLEAGNSKGILFVTEFALRNTIKVLGWIKAENDMLCLSKFNCFITILRNGSNYDKGLVYAVCDVICALHWSESQIAELKTVLQEISAKNPVLREHTQLTNVALAMRDEKTSLTVKEQQILIENLNQSKIIDVFARSKLGVTQRNLLKDKIIEHIMSFKVSGLNASMASTKLAVARNFYLCFRHDVHVKEFFLTVFKECFKGQVVEKLNEIIEDLTHQQRQEMAKFLKEKFFMWRRDFSSARAGVVKNILSAFSSPVIDGQLVLQKKIAEEYCRNIEEIYFLMGRLDPNEKPLINEERFAMSETLHSLVTSKKLSNLDVIILLEHCRSSVIVGYEIFYESFNILCMALMQDVQRQYEYEKRQLQVVLAKIICIWPDTMDHVIEKFLHHSEPFYQKLGYSSLKMGIDMMNTDQLFELEEKLSVVYDNGIVSSSMMVLIAQIEENLRTSSLRLPYAGLEEFVIVAADSQYHAVECGL